MKFINNLKTTYEFSAEVHVHVEGHVQCILSIDYLHTHTDTHDK